MWESGATGPTNGPPRTNLDGRWRRLGPGRADTAPPGAGRAARPGGKGDRPRYTPPMNDNQPPWPRPAQYKTKVDGTGGLVRVVLVGEPHDGRELFIDEKELPEEIYASPRGDAFEWWPARVKDVMARTAVGGDPAAPPVHYILRIPDDTLEPLFVSDEKAR